MSLRVGANYTCRLLLSFSDRPFEAFGLSPYEISRDGFSCSLAIIICLFNDAASNVDCIASNDWMVVKNGLEGM
jgi:hypothetical protein